MSAAVLACHRLVTRTSARTFFMRVNVVDVVDGAPSATDNRRQAVFLRIVIITACNIHAKRVYSECDQNIC